MEASVCKKERDAKKVEKGTQTKIINKRKRDDAKYG
jgi:hypothetical protein